jgi:hypothetical protein
MVKIRYSELPAGLHVAAAADREGTVVYLQPGLTSAQRRAALVRVRSSARMGQGPTLPRPAMARAIAADRVRTNARIGLAAARRHPLLFLPPVIVLVVSAIVTVFMWIQPLTVANQGNDAAVLPTLHVGISGAPGSSATAQVSTGPRQRHHHRHHRVAVPTLTQPRVQPALPAACAALQGPSSRFSWPTPPSRSSSVLTPRCLRRLRRWARSHQP